MCCTARCGCGVGVMILRLMWVYLSLAVLCHICSDVAPKVRTMARTEQRCDRKIWFFLTLNLFDKWISAN